MPVVRLMKMPDFSWRMRSMRSILVQYNVYRWAASLIGEVCDVRLDSAGDRQFRASASVG